MFDGKAFGQEVVAAVNDFLNKNLMPVVERLDVLEKRFADFPTPKDGEPGKDADAEAVAEIVARDVTARVEQVRTDLAGFRDDMEQTIETEVAKHFAKLPKVPTLDEVIEAIPAPQDGKSITPEELAPLIEDSVQRAIAALPVPKDGEKGIPGDPGRDGLDVKDLFVAEGGDLIATFADGRSKNLGKFRGEDGKGADLTAVEQLINSRLTEISLKETETAPPALAERISLAVKMMAQMPEPPVVQREYAQAAAPSFTVNLPPVEIPPIQFGENVIHVSVPEQKAPEVRVEAPIVNVSVPEGKKRRTETTVTEHDERGRISKFVQREL